MFITKVMVIALQLLVAVAIVGSFGALAMGDLDVAVGEPHFDFPEDPDPQMILDEGLEISINVPLTVKIGGLGDFDQRLDGYWPINDFQYNFSLVAAGWNHTGGVGPMDIEPGKVTDLTLNETILYKPGDDDLYDLVTDGAIFQFAMSISMGYMEDMFKYSTDVAATVEVGPFLDYGVNLENVTYDGSNLALPMKFDYDIDDVEDSINDILIQSSEETGFESVDDIVKELYKESPDLFPEDFDIDDYNLSDLDIEDQMIELLEEQGVDEVDTFKAQFTDSEGNVIEGGEFNASLMIVDGELVFQIEDIDDEFLEGIEDSDAELRIYTDLEGADLPGELDDAFGGILKEADGQMILKAPAGEIASIALGQVGV